MSEVLTSVTSPLHNHASVDEASPAPVKEASPKVKRIKPALRVKEVGNQSWTSKNLVVKSDHNNIRYYTTRWDALCPYIEVTEEMLDMAPKPFVVYAIPPDSPFGVPINDKYGLVNVADAGCWADERSNTVILSTQRKSSPDMSYPCPISLRWVASTLLTTASMTGRLRDL